MTLRKLRNSGFGIAEVVIAMGLLSVVALGLAQVMSDLSKNVKTNRLFASRDGLRLQLDRLIGSPQSLAKPLLIRVETLTYTIALWR